MDFFCFFYGFLDVLRYDIGARGVLRTLTVVRRLNLFLYTFDADVSLKLNTQERKESHLRRPSVRHL